LHFAHILGCADGQVNEDRILEDSGRDAGFRVLDIKRDIFWLRNIHDIRRKAIETTRIHSVAGTLEDNRGLVGTRPFRSPHHTISDAGLIGGGAVPRTGEVSLGHNGVLFLDELPEFQRNVLELMRQPLEDAMVTIARVAISRDFSFALYACGGHETVPVRIFRRSDARMPLHPADDSTLCFKDFRAVVGSHRYPD